MRDELQSFCVAAGVHVRSLLRQGCIIDALSMLWRVAVITAASWVAGDRLDVRNALASTARKLRQQDAAARELEEASATIAAKDAEIAALRRRVAAAIDNQERTNP
jgi:hypothetical protein